MVKNLIIAFCLGMLVMNYASPLKVPDIIMGRGVDPDLKEIIEDYVVKILNEGRYQCRVSSSAISSSDTLEAGEMLMDDSSATKYFIISNGTTHYRVAVTAIP